MDLQVELVGSDAVAPTRAHDGDAGLDLYAAGRAYLPPGHRVRMDVGFKVAIPDGYVGLVVPRSGLARRDGVTVLNAPGVIDAGYRGRVGVLLVNLASHAAVVEPGDRVAQLLVLPVERPVVRAVMSLPEAADGRGEGGFGSTGR